MDTWFKLGEEAHPAVTYNGWMAITEVVNANCPYFTQWAEE